MGRKLAGEMRRKRVAPVKQVVQVNNALRKGTMKDRNLYMGNDINNKTIGIVGLGNVGRRLAKLCATVFDMKVLAYDPFLDEKTIAERNATKVELDELMRRSDFVSINCPLDDTTRFPALTPETVASSDQPEELSLAGLSVYGIRADVDAALKGLSLHR